MFDIGFAELLLIGVVALLVLGPEKLPLAAKTCGLWLGRLKRSVSSIQREINEELRVEELRRTTAIEKEKLDQELNDMRRPFGANESDPVNREQKSPAPESQEVDIPKSDGEAAGKKSSTHE
ncbi:Sec-independent protein translocase protein TatB [Marinobacterium litorale]|uniref:Sec-independent protein translocase protein TatB n=1 Tax=Marinobacterium litorale TaxID=404770 RepID=UPI0003F69EF1|nr:Sec-independent protein translocase protein TatB [Marinobacterium litorale]